MKYLLTTLFLSLLLMSCGSDGTDTGNENSDQINTSIPAVTPATSPLPGANATPPAQPQTVNIPAGPDGVVRHYICTKSDGGFGDAAGPCPICGDAMAHNSAFHANQQAADIPPITIKNADGTTSEPSSVTTSPVAVPGGTPPAPPAGAEPPQNSKGVWHYTCSNGCAGGAGGASPCVGCGSTLVHNPVYHQ